MKDFREMLSRYLDGNRKKSVTLADWEAKNRANKHTFQQIEQNLAKCHKTAEKYQPNTHAAYDELLQKLNQSTHHTTPIFSISHYSIPQKIAASLLLFIISISVFYFITFSTNEQYKWAQLSSKDEFKDFYLEDGTHVWLHRNSSLEYPERFESTKREINLTGEAFIDVSPEATRPFFINTAASSEIQVMGTALNVRSHGDGQEEEIAVEHGEVMYRCAADSRPEMKLDKGECAVWHMKTGLIERMEETNPNVFSWKDHLLTFQDADCHTFEKILERYFGVEVTIKDTSLYQSRFSAEFKNKDLNQVLEYFNTREKITHEIKKDTCYLWKW